MPCGTRKSACMPAHESVESTIVGTSEFPVGGSRAAQSADHLAEKRQNGLLWVRRRGKPETLPQTRPHPQQRLFLRRHSRQLPPQLNNDLSILRLIDMVKVS